MSGYWVLLIGVIAAVFIWMLIAAIEIFRDQQDDHEL